MDARLSGVSAVSRRDASRHTMDRIRRVLIQCLGLNVDEADLDYERRLDESVGLDSVAALEFIAALEKEFCIKIESDMLELDKLRRLPQLAVYVETRVAQLPGGGTEETARGAS